MKITQYPRNKDGTTMNIVVGMLTDNTGNGGARLTNQPLAPDGSPINAVALLLVDSTGTPIPLPTGGVISGASAYERAVANGFAGTESQWLASLKGADSTIPGPRGNGILSDSDDPTDLDGINGDFWINTTTWYIFGPKASGHWPAGVPLSGGGTGEGGGGGGSTGTPVNTVAPTKQANTAVGQFMRLLTFGTWTNSPTSYDVTLYDTDGTVIFSQLAVNDVDDVAVHQFMDNESGETFRFGVVAHNAGPTPSAEAFTTYTAAIADIGDGATNVIQPNPYSQDLQRDSASGAPLDWSVVFGPNVFPGYEVIAEKSSDSNFGTLLVFKTIQLNEDDLAGGDLQARFLADGWIDPVSGEFMRLTVFTTSPNGHGFQKVSAVITPEDIVIPMTWNPSDKGPDVHIFNANMAVESGWAATRTNRPVNYDKTYWEVSTDRNTVGIYNASQSLLTWPTPTSIGGTPSPNASVYFLHENSISYNNTPLAGVSGTPGGGAMFTASVTGGVMTVTAVNSGALTVGMHVVGVGIPLGTTITSFGTGTGDTGTYNLGNSFTIPSTTNCLCGFVVGVAYDRVAQKVWYALEGVWQGSGTQNPATGAGGLSVAGIGPAVYPAAHQSNGHANYLNAGTTPGGTAGFIYSPPVGFVAP